MNLTKTITWRKWSDEKPEEHRWLLLHFSQWKHERNLLNVITEDMTEEEIEEYQRNCRCDNCFYGRTVMVEKHLKAIG